MAIIRQEFEEKIKPDGYNERVYPLTVDKAVYRKATNFSQVSLDDILSEGYRYGGVAIPNTTPSTIQRIFYLTSTEGTYTKFKDVNNHPITVISGEGLVVLSYDGQYWVKNVLPNLGGGGGSSAQPFTISYDGNVIFTYNPTATSQDFDFKTLLDGASVGSLSTPRNIFNIPFDGTQDVQGDNTSGKIPLIRSGLFTDQIYPLYQTRELGGCGRPVPASIKSHFPSGVVCNNYPYWGALYSRKLCNNIDSNLWSFKKGYCGVGSNAGGTQLTGVIDIRIPNTEYAKYTIGITNVAESLENVSTIVVETFMDSNSVLQKWVYTQEAITDYAVRIAKIGDVHHILIGSLTTKYSYYTITINTEITPRSLYGSALSATGSDKIEKYVDSVFDYITMNIIQSESAYTGNFISPTKFTAFVRTEGNSTINGNINLNGNLITGHVTPKSGGITIGNANNVFNQLHVMNLYSSPGLGLKHFEKYLALPEAPVAPGVNQGIAAIKIPTTTYAHYGIKVAAFGTEAKRTELINVSVAFNGAVAVNNVITTQGSVLDWNSGIGNGTDNLRARLAINAGGEAFILIGETTTTWQQGFVLLDCIASTINNLNVLGLSSIYSLELITDESIYTEIYPIVNGGTPPTPSDTYVFTFSGGSTSQAANLPSTSGTTAKIPIVSTKNGTVQAFTVASNTFSNGTCSVASDNTGVTITYNANSGTDAITGQIVLTQGGGSDQSDIIINVTQAGSSTYAFEFTGHASPYSYSLTGGANTATIPITSTKTVGGTTSNQSFSIYSNTFSNGTAIIQNNNLVINYNSNTSGSTISAQIVLKQATSNNTITLNLTQPVYNDYRFAFTGGSDILQLGSSASSAIVAITSTNNGSPVAFSVESNTFTNMDGSPVISQTYDSITIPYKKNSSSSALTGQMVLKQSGSNNTITLTINQDARSGPTPPGITPTLQIESASLSGDTLTINLKTNPTDSYTDTVAASDISGGSVKLLYWGHRMDEEDALKVVSSNWNGSWYTYTMQINSGAVNPQLGLYLKLAGNYYTPQDYDFDHLPYVMGE